MKKRKQDRLDRAFKIGCIIMLAMSLCLLAKAITDKVQNKPDEQSEAESVYIVYTDEQSHPYAVLTNPHSMDRAKPLFKLTDAEREHIAQIVAGQAGDRCLTAQTMVAQVMYNQMLSTGGNIGKTDYEKCDRRTPTADTYEAVDAIFTRGEWLLDDTVLWTGDAESPDEWHQTLRLVTTCDGIAFYEVAI